MQIQISVPKEKIAEFCKARGIRRFAIFGSALRPDFSPESDVDVLVEFNPGRVPGLLGIAGMEIELSGIFGNRRVDMRTLEDLSRYFRDDVVKEAQVQYEQEKTVV